MNDKGQKLSKQNLALALDTTQAPQLIQAALQALHQPAVLADSPQRMLVQAVAQWDLQRIPRQMQIAGVFA